MASDADERGDEGCTACTRGPGCSGAEEVYGLYAGAIRDGVANCADYLDRIIGQLEGVPSRHYVADKAHELRDAAGRLIGLCHDVEGWLRECGETIDREDGAEAWTEECVLVAGHDGQHSSHPPATTLELARDLAGKVAEASVGISDHLGWIAHDPGRLKDRSELEDLGRVYQGLCRNVDRLSPALSALRTAKSSPQPRGSLADGDGDREAVDEEEELVCSECEFEAESFEHLAGHRWERGH